MKKRDKELYIRVSEDELNEMKNIANYLDLPLSTFARNLLLVASEDAQFYKKIGVLKGAKKLIEFQEKFAEISKEFKTDKNDQKPAKMQSATNA